MHLWKYKDQLVSSQLVMGVKTIGTLWDNLQVSGSFDMLKPAPFSIQFTNFETAVQPIKGQSECYTILNHLLLIKREGFSLLYIEFHKIQSLQTFISDIKRVT